MIEAIQTDFKLLVPSCPTDSLRDGFREAEAAINLMTATLSSLRVKSAVAEARAAENFSTVTELADVLVRETGQGTYQNSVTVRRHRLIADEPVAAGDPFLGFFQVCPLRFAQVIGQL